MPSSTERERQPARRGKATGWLSRAFELNPSGINWGRAVMVLDVMLVPLVVFLAIGHEEYLLSALLGAVYSVLVDPGGSYGRRARDIAAFGLTGAAVTALAFGIGADAWGWLVLAAFAVTLVAGLAMALGAHRFVEGNLLSIWFIIALGTASSAHHAHVSSYTWAQVLAWARGVGAMDRGDVHRQADPRAPGPAPAVRGVAQ